MAITLANVAAAIHMIRQEAELAMDGTEDPDRRQPRAARPTARLTAGTPGFLEACGERVRELQQQSLAQAGLPPPNNNTTETPVWVLPGRARLSGKATYQRYQQAARARARKISHVFDQVGLIQVRDHAEVQQVEDGAFVEAVIWIPRSVLEGLDG